MVKNTAYTDMFMYTIGPIAILYFLFELMKLKTSVDKSKLIAAFLFIAFSILFWAFFEQSGGSLSLFAANNLSDKLLFFNIDPNIVNNTSNSLFVILFSPLLGLLWIGMNKRKLEPNTVIKFGLGFLFLSAAFYVFYYTRFFADSNGVTSLNVFALAYLVITLGELCLSPIGLSIITKLSPKHLSGMMMGLWFLGSAYGQYVAGILGAGMSTPNDDASKVEKLMAYTDGYKQLAIYALVCGLILIVISSLMKKLMHGVK
jgi:POT family proton-dependent oligopeptide transporter